MTTKTAEGIRLGELIRKKREAKSLSRLELADKLGYSLRAVEQWERGERVPSAVVFLAICFYLASLDFKEWTI
jgi:transcriptional regulator with XRE-family HTH domain